MTRRDSRIRPEALGAIHAIIAGAAVGDVESETLDCKEDPSTRDDRGGRLPGSEEDDGAARLVADEAACLGNHHGGVVVVGIDDKASGSEALVGTKLDATWLRKRIRELTTPPLAVTVEPVNIEGVRLLVVDVLRNEGSEPFAASVSKRGGQRRARRVGSDCHEMTTVAEMLEWARHRSGYDWSAQPSGLDLDAARAGAVEALRDLLRASGEPDRVALAEAAQTDLLRQLQLVRPDGRLTRSGELLLCVSERPRLVYAHRPVLGSRSTTRVELLGRSLAEELRAVLEAFSANNPKLGLPSIGIAEGAVEALPLGAVREAIVNAIMHRDWERPDPIAIDHAGDELVAFSPGGFLEGISPRTVLTAPSRTRNRALGDTLRSLRIAEREGTGVDRMFIELIRVGHPPPEFHERDGGVRVTLQGGAPVVGVVEIHSRLPSKLRASARTAVALHLLRSRPSISLEELADAAQEEPADVRGFLDEAVDANLLKPTANPRPGGIRPWRLADQHRQRLGPILPYFSRPAEESVRLIADLARSQGEVRNQDVQDLLGLAQARASQLLKHAESEGVIELGPGSQPVGRGTYYVSTTRAR